MRSARIIKAPKGKQDPEEAEMAARARAAMRRLRGVKLNISDERITFDDVAGIGEAKVGIPCVAEHGMPVWTGWESCYELALSGG